MVIDMEDRRMIKDGNVRLIKPAYYDRFSCIGSRCRKSCCKGWRIDVTKKEFLKIRSLPLCRSLEKKGGKLFKRLRSETPGRGYVVMNLDEGGGCRFLTEEGLCRLQLEHGHEMLPDTCKIFPRNHTFIIENERCSMMSNLFLGCEAVLEQLWEYPNGIPLVQEEIRIQGEGPIANWMLVEERPAFRYYPELSVMAHLILQEKKLPLSDRLLYLGIVLRDVDRMEKEKETQQIPYRIQTAMRDLERGTGELLKTVERQPMIQIINAVKMMQIFFVGTKLNSTLTRISENLHVDRKGLWDGKELSVNMRIDGEYIEEVERSFAAFLGEKAFILENIASNWFSYLRMPFHLHDKSIWENYLLFIGLFHMLHYMIMGYVGKEGTMEDFSDIVVACSRELMHSRPRMKQLLDYFVRNEMNSLAHVAIMLK